MTPKISVVMSVYNAGAYLREAVDSILAQTFEDFEFLIIDDGSTDDSLPMLQSLNDRRIRLIAQENRGLVASLNRGITESTGQYIARMDADDRAEPDRFQLQIDYFKAHPEIALLGGSIATMDESGNSLAPYVPFPQTHEEIWSAVGRRPWVFCHPAVMFQRDAAIEVGLYKSDFAHCEDAEFFARLMTRYRAANMPQLLLKYRLCKSAVSSTKREHGRLNAQLVATIIDRWQPGQPFAPTAEERRATDDAIAVSQSSVTAAQMDSAYHCRLGRELLRGRQWRRAMRHYFSAAKTDRFNRMPYMGMVCALLHLGGGPLPRDAELRDATDSEQSAGPSALVSRTGVR